MHNAVGLEGRFHGECWGVCGGVRVQLAVGGCGWVTGSASWAGYCTLVYGHGITYQERHSGVGVNLTLQSLGMVVVWVWDTEIVLIHPFLGC